ncbi:MAG: hypothetical protein JSV33_07305 [bacterium]|nr:MAG: hypothetical protein JSV33_07305 [bacterium]
MKRTVVLLTLGMLLLGILATSLFSGEKEEDLPKFFVRKTKVDLGDFYEGADITYTFVVRNQGKGELHILNVRPG